METLVKSLREDWKWLLKTLIVFGAVAFVTFVYLLPGMVDLAIWALDLF